MGYEPLPVTEESAGILAATLGITQTGQAMRLAKDVAQAANAAFGHPLRAYGSDPRRYADYQSWEATCRLANPPIPLLLRPCRRGIFFNSLGHKRT